jgi:hypothetical protein
MTSASFFLRQPLPTYRIWKGVWTGKVGPAEAQIFISRVQAKYVELLARSKHYSPRVLQKLHFEKNILPAIAAYRVLLMDGHSHETALPILDTLLEATLARQKRLYRFLGRSRFFFDLLRLTLKPLTFSQYPSAGWQMDFPRLGHDAVGLDSHSCFYLQVLTEYGLPELTSHFCRLDDFLYEDVSPYIRFERRQTIGRGGAMCDFRYYRVKQNQG